MSKIGLKKFKHGDAGRVSKGRTISKVIRLYRIWEAMKGRCRNPKAQKYEYYGKRGVTVCDEWLEYIPFKKWALSHGYQDNLTIDRINNNGNYTPKNCQWITKSENARKSNKILSEKI